MKPTEQPVPDKVTDLDKISEKRRMLDTAEAGAAAIEWFDNHSDVGAEVTVLFASARNARGAGDARAYLQRVLKATIPDAVDAARAAAQKDLDLDLKL